MPIIYITIGNSDDKLTQQQWAHFVAAVGTAIARAAGMPGGRMHGAWTSGSHLPWQNACWCLHLPADQRSLTVLRVRLGRLARRFRQDAIAWAIADTEFIGPAQAGGP